MRWRLLLVMLLALWSCDSTKPSPPELHNRIVFLSNRDAADEHSYKVYNMAPDGSEVSSIGAYITDGGARPVVSPDGRRLTFATNGDIYVADAGGGDATNLTLSPTGDGDPVWSPDGQRIAFTTARSGSADIYIMNRDGSGATRLTDDPGYESHPAWSPDGSRIAYTSIAESVRFPQIYIIGIDGSDPTNLTNSPETGHCCPVWSPDGTRIAFVSDRLGVDEPRALFVMDPDGGNPARVGDVIGISDPVAWSPDGKQLVFEARQPEPECTGGVVVCRDIYVINSDGSGLLNLTRSPDVDDVNPSWSR